LSPPGPVGNFIVTKAYGSDAPVNVVALSSDEGEELALPISILWTGSQRKRDGADINLSNKVNLVDLTFLADRWLRSDCTAPDWCDGADINPKLSDRGQVNITDFAILCHHWLDNNCD